MSGVPQRQTQDPPEEVAIAIALALSVALADAAEAPSDTAWQRSARLRPAWTSAYADAWRAQTCANVNAYPE